MFLGTKTVVITKIRERNPSFYPEKKDGAQEVQVHPHIVSHPSGWSFSFQDSSGSNFGGFLCFFPQKRHFT